MTLPFSAYPSPYQEPAIALRSDTLSSAPAFARAENSFPVTDSLVAFPSPMPNRALANTTTTTTTMPTVLPVGAPSTAPSVPKAPDEEQTVPQWQATPTAHPAKPTRVERLPSIEQLAQESSMKNGNLELPPLRLVTKGSYSFYQKFNPLPMIQNSIYKVGKPTARLVKKSFEGLRPVWNTLEPRLETLMNVAVLPFSRSRPPTPLKQRVEPPSSAVVPDMASLAPELASTASSHCPSSNAPYPLHVKGPIVAISQSHVYLLTTCLQYLHGAQEHLEGILHHFNGAIGQVAQLEPAGSSPALTPAAPGSNPWNIFDWNWLPAMTTSIQLDVAQTLGRVVNIVSQFATALPLNVQTNVKHFILHMPYKWATHSFSLSKFPPIASLDQARLATDLITDSINMLVSIEHVVAEYLVKSGIPVSSLPLLVQTADEDGPPAVDALVEGSSHGRVDISLTNSSI